MKQSEMIEMFCYELIIMYLQVDYVITETNKE